MVSTENPLVGVAPRLDAHPGVAAGDLAFVLDPTLCGELCNTSGGLKAVSLGDEPADGATCRCRRFGPSSVPIADDDADLEACIFRGG